MTSIFFDYGGANEVKLNEGTVHLSMRARAAFSNKLAADNSFWENLGAADRDWVVTGGPISVADLAKLKALVDSTSQVHFRAPITSNADVHVLVLSVDTDGSTEVPDTATKCLYITAVLREAT